MIGALLVAVLTLRDAMMILTMPHADTTRSYIAYCLAILWLVIVLITTVHASFEVAGNGYFSAWLGLSAAVVLLLEEKQRALAVSPHVRAAASYTAAGLLLVIESAQYAFKSSASFACVNAALGVPTVCSSGLAGFAIAYGVVSVVFGASLLVLMVMHKGDASTSGSRLPAALRVPLANVAALVLDGPPVVVGGLKIVPFRVLTGLLLVLSLATALSLTYFFPPYTDLGNGFLACWVSVCSAAMLLRGDPLAELDKPTLADNLAVMSTITSDAAAAELGVPTVDAGAAGSRPTNHLLPPTPGKPPLASALAIAAGLVVVAGVDRLDDEFADLHAECMWAIVCGSLTLLALLVRAAIISGQPVQLDEYTMWAARAYLAGVLTAVWAASVLVLTFIGPFVDTGNGYVATWAAFGCAVALVLDETKESTDGS